MNAPIATKTRIGGSLERMVRRRASDKSVRDRATTAKLVNGQIIVENKTCGIIFSFPVAVWPDATMSAYQRMWVERLTPWWDMEQPQWSPTSQRLRESCVKAINNLAGIQTEQEGARVPQATPDTDGVARLETRRSADGVESPNGGTQRPGTQDAEPANPDAQPGSMK